MQIIAHRGASFFAPENTLSAFRLGLKQGADGVELDVRLTADNRIIAMHDSTAKRTAGKYYKISRTTYEKLKTLDAGIRKSAEYRNEPVPLLNEVLDMVPKGKKVYVEIKCGKEITPFLSAMLADFSSRRDDIVLFGFGFDTISFIKKAMPAFSVLWIGEFGFNIKHTDFDHVVAMLDSAGLDGFSTMQNRLYCFEMAKRLKDRVMNVWTVDDTAEADFYREIGVTSLTTNRPDLMVRF